MMQDHPIESLVFFRVYPDPSDDGTKNSLLIRLSRRWVGEDASRINDGPVNLEL